MKHRHLLLLCLFFFRADFIHAQATVQSDEEALYELADAAAETEVEKAADVLEKDTIEHGEEWWTMEKLIGILSTGVLLLFLIFFFFLKWLNKRRENRD